MITYQDAHAELTYHLTRLKTSLANYKLQDKANDYHITIQEQLIQAIEDFMRASRFELDDTLRMVDTNTQEFIQIEDRNHKDLVELVKKLGLLVMISGIKYPTVAQPLSIIHDHYCIVTGRLAEMGLHPNRITITLPVI